MPEMLKNNPLGFCPRSENYDDQGCPTQDEIVGPEGFQGLEEMKREREKEEAEITKAYVGLNGGTFVLSNLPGRALVVDCQDNTDQLEAYDRADGTAEGKAVANPYGRKDGQIYADDGQQGNRRMEYKQASHLCHDDLFADFIPNQHDNDAKPSEELYDPSNYKPTAQPQLIDLPSLTEIEPPSKINATNNKPDTKNNKITLRSDTSSSLSNAQNVRGSSISLRIDQPNGIPKSNNTPNADTYKHANIGYKTPTSSLGSSLSKYPPVPNSWINDKTNKGNETVKNSDESN